MRKVLQAVAVISAAAFTLSAQNTAVIRISAAASEIPVSNLSAMGNGVLEYGTGKERTKLLPGKYLYAWVPKPDAVAEADKKLEKTPSEALQSYANALVQYKYLGWDIYCMTGSARALYKMGRAPEAIAMLDRIGEYKLQNPRQLEQQIAAERLNILFRISSGDYAGAEKRMNRFEPQRAADAAYLFLQKGRIALLKKKTDEALSCFLKTAFLYPDTPEAPEAIRNIAAILEEKKDPRAARFRELLKKEYSPSVFKSLFQ